MRNKILEKVTQSLLAKTGLEKAAAANSVQNTKESMNAKLQRGLGTVLQNAMRKETILETNYGIENESSTV
jgi:hypothetical protein